MKRIWLLAAIAGIIISVLLDLFFARYHVELPWNHIPGFFAFFGLLGCLLIVGVAKLLGHYWLERGEDYYDRNNDDDK